MTKCWIDGNLYLVDEEVDEHIDRLQQTINNQATIGIGYEKTIKRLREVVERVAGWDCACVSTVNRDCISCVAKQALKDKEV